MQNEKIEKYTYKMYSEASDPYRETFSKEIKERNQYFLLGTGGGIIFLYNSSGIFKGIINLLIWGEISLFIIMGLLTLYSMHLRTYVSNEYMEIYDNFYEKYGEKDYTDEARNELIKALEENKSMKSLRFFEKCLNLIMIGIGIYTLILLLFILGQKLVTLIEQNRSVYNIIIIISNK